MNSKAVETIEVPGYQGRAVEVRKGDVVRITDVEGCQIGDLFLIARDDPMEIFSPALTRLVNFTPFPRVGEPFISSRRRAMVTLITDRSPGRHDMTFAPCDPEFYRTLGAGDNHPSCRNNFERAMQAIGRSIPVYPDPVNVFQNTPIDAQGNYILGQTQTKPGDYIELRCEMDLVVALTACSTDVPLEGVEPIGGKSTPLRIEVFRGGK
jgi:uncharacterized protein YcgI (DUF1989 family)